MGHNYLGHALALLTLAGTSPVLAEVGPAAHWGAALGPELADGLTIGLQVMLLSEFGKEPEKGPTRRGEELLAERYGAIEATHGLAFVSLHDAGDLPVDVTGRTRFTLTGFFGGTHDPLTEHLQNDIIHTIGKLEPVARDETSAAFFFGLGGEVNHFVVPWGRRRGPNPYLPIFVGAGVSLGTLWQDLYVQFGAERLRPFLGYNLVSLTAIARTGIAYGGVGAGGWLLGFDDDVLTTQYLLTQAGASIHPLELCGRHWLDIEECSLSLLWTGDSGLFLRENARDRVEAEQGFAETFYVVRVELGDFRFETFNDSFGNKDKGPSYGARMFYRFDDSFNWREPVLGLVLTTAAVGIGIAWAAE